MDHLVYIFLDICRIGLSLLCLHDARDVAGRQNGVVSRLRGGCMSAQARVNLAVGPIDQTEGVSLSWFLARVKAVVNSAIPDPAWVRAEIRKVQTAKSGHVYLELEERSEKGLSEPGPG